MKSRTQRPQTAQKSQADRPAKSATAVPSGTHDSSVSSANTSTPPGPDSHLKEELTSGGPMHPSKKASPPPYPPDVEDASASESHLEEELASGGPMHPSKEGSPAPHLQQKEQNSPGAAMAYAEPLDKAEESKKLRAIEASPSYLRAYEDINFLRTKELRPVRLQLELLKPELILEREKIESTIVVFGGTRLVSRAEAQARIDALEARLLSKPKDSELMRELAVAYRILAKSKYYDEARAFGRLVSQSCQIGGHCDYVIMTGGGPGVMEAANRGAYDVGAKSIGMNITLPHEQSPNPYITPELCFQFHYFAVRKMHLLLRAKALLAFPGGYGTLDELFETLTLVQTLKVKPLPVLLVGGEFWQSLINFQYLVDEGVIDSQDIGLFSIVDTAEEAWKKICEFYTIPESSSPA